MPQWCLVKEKADKFKEMLRSGKINPATLNAMTFAERRSFFTTNFGEANAKQINAAFEKTLLLKNQRNGMVTWAKKVLGSNPVAQRDVLSKINKLDKALNEKELDDFLNDLVESKVGFQISEKEFKQLSELGEDATQKKTIALDKMKDGKWILKEGETPQNNTNKDKYGMDFGASKVAFDNYFSGLALRAKGKPLKNVIETFKNQGLLKATETGLIESVDFIASNSRAMVAAWDNSFWGRQGRRALGRYATSRLWVNNFQKSLIDAKDVIFKGGIPKGNAILDSVKVEIYSRENYLNDNYNRGKKLDIGVREEEFPSSLPEKIPGFGRIFKASEVTYEAGATRLRADIADKFYNMAEKTGVNLKLNEEVGAINEIVNIMTGRGTFRGVEEFGGGALNKIFFSVKFAISQIQTLTKTRTAKTKFARKQAAINLASLVASSATLLGMLYMLWPDRVEVDARSTNFGKMKIGNVWVDVTGGSASYLVLAERIRRQSYKNSNTGIVTSFNDGYGTPDGMDVFFNFWENKTSPFASIIKNQVNQKTFEGGRPSLFTEAMSLMTPIIVDAAQESLEVQGQMADMLTAIIADGFGLSVSSYLFETNWESNTSKKLEKFKEDVGEKAFIEANKRYNREVSDMYLTLNGDKEYIEMNNDERKKEITKRKNKIKKDIID